MNVLLLVPKAPFVSQSAGDGFVRVFYPYAFVVRRLGGELAAGRHSANQWRLIGFSKAFSLFDEDFVVRFTKRWCQVNEACPRIDGNKWSCDHAP